MYHCKMVCRKAKVQVATLIDVVASADERGGEKKKMMIFLSSLSVVKNIY